MHTAKQVLALASPVVVTELSGTAIRTIDILMVSHLGPEAIGAVGMGGLLFGAPGGFGFGFLFCLDPLVAQAFGARRLGDCHRWLIHGVFAAVVIGAALWLVSRAIIGLLPAWGINPVLEPLVASYLAIASWNYVPMLIGAALRRYLQAMSVVVPTAIGAFTSIAVTLLADWALIFGELGAPPLGTDGAALASCARTTYTLLFTGCVVIAYARRRKTGLFQTSLRLDEAWLRQMARLGAPAGIQFALDIGVFAVVSALAGRLDAASSAAHQIVFTVIAAPFVVTLGVAGAGAVLVGQSMGRREASVARSAGWTALLLAAGFMAATGAVMVARRWEIVRLFTEDSAVVAAGATILLIAAIFQLFDGVQVVATGILRGLRDTRTPMLANFVAHWLLGLPLGYALCFGLGFGVVGLWMGLSVGIVLVGTFLLIVWTRRSRSLSRALAPPGETPA